MTDTKTEVPYRARMTVDRIKVACDPLPAMRRRRHARAMIDGAIAHLEACGAPWQHADDPRPAFRFPNEIMRETHETHAYLVANADAIAVEIVGAGG